MKTFKYRLFPTAGQRHTMESILEECRWLYNHVLGLRRDAWEKRHEQGSLFAMVKMLPELKKGRPSLKAVYAMSLQDVCLRVDLAFSSYFRKAKIEQSPRLPRNHRKDEYRSFTYPQYGYGFHIQDGRLQLPKVGAVKINLHRPIQGAIKRLVVVCEPLGKWYVCFSVEETPAPLPPTQKVVGVDLGVHTFAALSDGEKITRPALTSDKQIKAWARAKRKLAEYPKDSSEYRKAERVVQHLQEKRQNRSRDFAHKLSRKLVNENQFIAFESLKANGDAAFSSHVRRGAWSELLRLTASKAGWAKRGIVQVDPAGTSQECSGCGQVVQKDLTVRVHVCPHCGLEIDRDVNAARNILTRGLACIGSQSVITPVSPRRRWRTATYKTSKEDDTAILEQIIAQAEPVTSRFIEQMDNMPPSRAMRIFRLLRDEHGWHETPLPPQGKGRSTRQLTPPP